MRSKRPLWTPSAELLQESEMAQLRRDVGAGDYNQLWEWSVDDVERFWRAMWDRFEIDADGSPDPVLGSAEMPGADWFPNARLSFPEHIFRAKDPAETAVVHICEHRPPTEWSWAELAAETARVRAGLRRFGVERGDRVVAHLPNTPETLAAFLAVTSLGAVWSCCSPDFGARTVVDRFAQIEPKVLLAADGYRYGGRDFDRTEVVDALEAALPTLERTVRLPYLGESGDWQSAFPPTGEPLTFERVPFGHPLWIVYSSGTTGLPKAIVHGHGGPLLEHLKSWRLHHDLRPGDRALWISTTGWMMWNYLVGALLSRASVVLFDANPGHPDMNVVWRVLAEHRVDIFGAGAAYFHGCMKAGAEPADAGDLSRLRMVGSTGSPLAPEAFTWLSDKLGEDIWIVSTSGGTDVAGGFVGGSPISDLHTGEIQARNLGVAVEAWNEAGEPVVDEVGELVVTKPMPSMPVCFWNDPGDERYRDAYFSIWPGIWRHGDWIRITSRGSAVIYGRSDATVNRAGVRMGTAEIYAAVLRADAVVDALAVDVPPPEGTGDSWLALFVVLRDGAGLSEELIAELRRRIRSDCSPRHVPDDVIAAPEIPRTLTGKTLELPVKKLFMGMAPESAANADALANPDALEWFAEYARTFASNRWSISNERKR